MSVVVTAEVVILLVIMLAVIGVDLYLDIADPPGDTFSALSRAWARDSPFWPWTLGLLAGRFFHWGQQPVLPDPMGTIGAFVITFCFVALFSWRKLWDPIRSNVGMPGSFLLAYVLGAFFWPVNVQSIRFHVG